jgi:hypothetical protein
VVDVRTFRATVVRTGVSRLTMTPDGALYMLHTSPDGGLTHLARYVVGGGRTGDRYGSEP